MKKKRTKHDYTSETELNSILIREKNKKLCKNFSTERNQQINKLIKTFVNLTNTKYPPGHESIQKKVRIRKKLKRKITELSEITNIDKDNHERFGEIILLMIKHILTKSNFSGYTYTTEFYSDAIHKILKYLHNFDHTLISKRSGHKVNAFAYISQIIHNSIISIINQKKKEQNNNNANITLEISQHSLNITDHRKINKSTYEEPEEVLKEFKIDPNDDFIKSVKEIIDKHHESKDKDKKIVIMYPKSHIFTVQEYYELRPLIKGTSIIGY